MQKLKWSKQNQYLRLDGKVSPQIRQQHTQIFNDPNSSVQVSKQVSALADTASNMLGRVSATCVLQYLCNVSRHFM